MANAVVILFLVAILFYAVRKVIKSRKSGGCCGCSSGSCSSKGCSCNHAASSKKKIS